MAVLPITRASLSAPAFDQRALYLRGLEYVRALAGQTWTDHNAHDPGITALELLCYALTDLSYRASWPLPDLLATADGDNTAHMRAQFYSARRILPNRARSAADLRKLLIDLPGVRNAWIRPQPVTLFADLIGGRLVRERPPHGRVREVRVSGVFRVLLEYMDGVTDEQRAEIDARAVDRLRTNRNLCEDVVGIDAVPQQGFQLCGEIELRPDADPARVTAHVLDVVQQYLAPPVMNYALADMLRRVRSDGTPVTVPDAFEGPALSCGFVDDDELARAELRTEVRLSDVINLIMDVDGVRAVRDLLLNPVGLTVPPDTRWVVPVAPGMQPVLDVSASRLVLYKRNVPVVPDSARVEQLRRETADAARALLEEPLDEDVPIPQGTCRHPGRYYSFQNHFPEVYGLGDAGIPGDGSAATRVRRGALADQLKAYLLFFDQIMADYCAQLAHVPDLFSIDPTVQRTCFAQIVDSFRGFADLYQIDEPGLNALVESFPGGEDRRARFLDHLAARVGERFQDYAHLMDSLFGASEGSLITDRCAFLRDCPELGAVRGLGEAVVTDPDQVWDAAEVSGLQRRVGRLLGLPDVLRRTLGSVTLDANATVTGNLTDQFGFEVRHPETGAVLMTQAASTASEDDAAASLRRALELGQLRSGFRASSTSEAEHTFAIVAEDGTVVANGPTFDTATERDGAVRSTVELLRDRYSREGLHLVETILLRPIGETDPLLPICVDPNCTGCEDDDPYSYRIHVILPAYAGRFRQMEFRRFVEEVIREETPANVLPRVCFVSEAEMQRFEPLYRSWLELLAGREVENRAGLLEAFIQELYHLKNVYPAQTLASCETAEATPKFVLGQTALGTALDVEE